MINDEDVEILQEIIEEAGFEHYNYTGRGMDKECVAFTISRDRGERLAIADLMDATGGDLERIDCLSHAIRTALTDGKGLDSVMYFPSYETE